jgi:DNA-binding transcriptional MerR regulator
MAKSITSKSSPSEGHRIGAVAALSGVPVPTLRVWEVRYGTFSPRMTAGGQRIYNDEDVLRATLLKRLTEHGHSISSIASHDAAKLNTLLQQQDTTQRLASIKHAQRQSLNVAVVGVALAARLASQKFKQIFSSAVLHTSAVYEDLDAALTQAPSDAPDFLLVQVNAVHAIVQAQLHRLISHSSHRPAPQVIVLYRFGQEHVAQSMKRSGMVVRREPVSDYELADLFRSSLLLDAPQAMEQTGLGATIPPRKYTDATLARMAATSTNILCECPRHVAEIITQLVSFEKYSQDCLNKSTEDAHLHAYLHSVSGSARALFEHALQMVADHEGLKLQDADESHRA